jgi:iron complex outermembrane receptor protein
MNLLTRWQRAFDDGASTNLVAYYDRTERDFPGVYNETLDTLSLEFQHALRPLGAHSVIWGANYRHNSDREENGRTIAFLPAQLSLRWASLFAQDEIALRTDLHLTFGTRLAHNDYTGLELLPSARLAWQLSDNRLLWGAVSRTVRAPSRVDRDLYSPAQAPFLLQGNSTFRSETAKVAELGYRAQPATNLSYSVTVFHSIYDDLRSLERLPSGVFIIGNEMEGTTTGVEAWGTYQAMPRWRLSAGFTALRERLSLKPGSTDPIGASAAGNDPAMSLQLRSTFNISAHHEFDVTLRHVAALPNPSVPAYTVVDMRFGWKLRRDLELSVTGQNLGPRHAEFGAAAARSEVEPGILVKLIWQN